MGRGLPIYLWIFTESCILSAASNDWNTSCRHSSATATTVHTTCFGIQQRFLSTLAFLMLSPNVPNQIPVAARPLNDSAMCFCRAIGRVDSYEMQLCVCAVELFLYPFS